MDEAPERASLQTLTVLVCKSITGLNKLLSDEASPQRDNKMRSILNQLEVHNFDAMRFGLNQSAEYIAKLKTGRAPRTSSATPKDAKSPADERTNHPAIQAVRELRGKYPNKDVWDLVIKTCGDTPDLERMKECWVAWRSKNYSPLNLAWLVDWYVNGIPTSVRQLPFSKSDATIAATREVVKEYEH